MSKWRRPPSRPAPVVARLRGEFAAPVLAPVDAGAISSPLGVKYAQPHHSRHDLAPTRKPRSAGDPTPLRARFLAALLRGDFAAPVLALLDAGAISSPLGVVFAKPHHSRHDLAPTRKPCSAGRPSPSKGGFFCRAAAGGVCGPSPGARRRGRHLLAAGREVRPAEPHHSRHDLAPTRPPGSAGGPPPLRARFLAALLRWEFAAPVPAPVDAGAISSPLGV